MEEASLARRFAIVASVLALLGFLAVAYRGKRDGAATVTRIRGLRVVPARKAVLLEWTSDRPVETAIDLVPMGHASRRIRGDRERRRSHHLVLKELRPDLIHRFRVLADGEPCGRETSFRPRARIVVSAFHVEEADDGVRITWRCDPPCRCEISYRCGDEALSCPAEAQPAERHAFRPLRWDEGRSLEDFVVTAVDAVGNRHVDPPRRVPGLVERWRGRLEEKGRKAFLDEMTKVLLGPSPVERAWGRLDRLGMTRLVKRLLDGKRELWTGDRPWAVYDSLVELRMLDQLRHHRRLQPFLDVAKRMRGFVDEGDEGLFGDESREVFRMRFPKWKDVFYPANLSDRDMARAEATVALMLPVARTIRRKARFVVSIDAETLAAARDAELELSGYQFYTNYMYEFRHDEGRRFLVTNPNREDDIPIRVTLHTGDERPSLNVQRRRWVRFPRSFFRAGENGMEMTLYAVGPGGSLLSTVQDLVIRLR